MDSAPQQTQAQGHPVAMDIEQGAGTNVAPSSAKGAVTVSQVDKCASLNKCMRFTQYDANMLITASCQPKCCSVPVYLYLVKGFCCVYSIWHTAEVWDYTDWGTWSHSFMYLTDWGAVVTSAYFTLATLMLFLSEQSKCDFRPYRAEPAAAGVPAPLQQVNPACCGPRWSIAQRLQFVLFELLFIMQFVITLMYWFAIYDWGEDDRSAWAQFNNVSVHGIFFVFTTTELFITRVQFQWRHLGWVFVFSAVYLIVNLISTKDYKPVYSIMTWEDTDTLIIVVEAYVMMGLGYLLGIGLVKARDSCCCKYRSRGN